MDIQTLEGVRKRFVVRLADSEGAPVDATLYDFGGGAECTGGLSVDMEVVEVTRAGAVLELPALTPGPVKAWTREREPWRYQLRATEKATGGLFVVLSGAASVTEWRGATGADGAAMQMETVQAVVGVDGSAVQVSVTLGNVQPSTAALAALGLLQAETVKQVVQEVQAWDGVIAALYPGATGGCLTFAEPVEGVNRVGVLFVDVNKAMRLRLPGGEEAGVAFTEEYGNGLFWHYFEFDAITFTPGDNKFEFTETGGTTLAFGMEVGAALVVAGGVLHAEGVETGIIPAMVLQKVEEVERHIPAAAAAIDAAVEPVAEEVKRLTAQTAGLNKQVAVMDQGPKNFSSHTAIYGGWFRGWQGGGVAVNRVSFYVFEEYVDEARAVTRRDVMLTLGGAVEVPSEVPVEAVYVESTAEGVMLRVFFEELTLSNGDMLSCRFGRALHMWLYAGAGGKFAGKETYLKMGSEQGTGLAYVLEYMSTYDAKVHAADGVAHVNTDDRAAWNAKLTKEDLEEMGALERKVVFNTGSSVAVELADTAGMVAEEADRAMIIFDADPMPDGVNKVGILLAENTPGLRVVLKLVAQVEQVIFDKQADSIQATDDAGVYLYEFLIEEAFICGTNLIEIAFYLGEEAHRVKLMVSQAAGAGFTGMGMIFVGEDRQMVYPCVSVDSGTFETSWGLPTGLAELLARKDELLALLNS